MLHANQTFGPLYDFIEALRNWAIVEKFDFRWKFSDSQRAKANCVHPDCPFTIRCNYYEKEAIVKVTVLVSNHNCIGNPTTARSQASRLDWLLGALPLVITVHPTTTTKSIIDAINIHYGHTIEAQQARRVRKEILNTKSKKLLVDYTKVPAYIRALR
jgi:MuDR family transposase